ncbi:metalloprotease [Nocardioides sp. MH1]|uniref:metalloprotease n=1 Tax=Nocardioides sp. MH1 TaxID=3242490 RepID=UPI003521FBF6
MNLSRSIRPGSTRPRPARTGTARRSVALLGSLLACTIPLTVVVAGTGGAAHAASQTCLTGRLTYTFADAEGIAAGVQPVRNASWELRGVPSGSSSTKTLATGTTSASDGTFQACAAYAALSSASVRFTSQSNQMWRVIASDRGAVHSFDTATKTNVTGNVDLGTVSPTASTAGAFKIVDTLNKLYWKRGTTSPCWTWHQTTTSTCKELTVVWNSTTTDGGYWSPSTTYVYLAKDDPASQHLILHEAGHWFQWALYNGWFPKVTGCNPHYVDRESTVSCAWTEGFANAVAGYVLGDKRYVRPDGSVVPYQQADGSPWPGGDATEGNVAAALIDLFKLDGGTGGDWSGDLDMISRDGSDDFREYYVTDRPAHGYSVTGEAERIINSHGIDY